MGAREPLPDHGGTGDETGEVARSSREAASAGRVPKEDAQAPWAGQLMGFAGQLKSWRKVAGHRRGRRVTQEECATAVERSERWWRDLERGDGRNRLDRDQCDKLAELLQLDRDEYHALLLYNNLGHTATSADASGTVDPRVRSGLRLLIDKQMPSPTYLCDANWNIVGYNAAMAEWWPWVLEPGANLMRWALTTQEARAQYHDWNRHATEYVKMLKFALAGRGDSAELMELIGDVCKDPKVRHIWETCTDLTENRDGHIFRMSIPAMGWEPIDVVSHVLYPAAFPEYRFVVITWWAKEDGEEEARDVDTALGASGAKPQVQDPPAPPTAAARRRVAHAITGRITVPTAEAAAALAGEDAVPLPVLSRLMGEKCQLTLSPSAQSVIWAVKEEDGEWSVSEVAVYTAIVKLPHAATDPEAFQEMKLLVRANLPAAPKEASDRIQELLPQLKNRIHFLEQIARDLHEQDPSLPYVWDPTDEI
ncbi:helix-turn-helix transcriptional regulator [Streptomyces changanensis]|uniref:Helix-turn-helix transcriptional regulator n=2 Tax=Streptomyces TaxID=1883 RepID=A0ABY5ND98_9ACTN|nr:helix-turn-helix transcriptional regulator [Streptomyces changanensis]UUS33993.1 helix-turn-helix transcriptional regulator [Streptomyces changanensis]